MSKLDKFKQNLKSNSGNEYYNESLLSINKSSKLGVDKNGSIEDGFDAFYNLVVTFSKNPGLKEAMKRIFAEIETTLGSNADAYTKTYVGENNKTYYEINKTRDRLLKIVDIQNNFIRTLVDLETISPYSMFYYIMDAGFSDMIFHMKGVKLSDNIEVRNKDISKEFRDTYKIILNHFINNIKFLTESKLDTSNPVLNAELNIGRIGIIRYNIIDQTLNGRRGWPIVVIRKQTVSNLKLGDEYLKSLGLTDSQIDWVKKSSMQGSTLIVGDVGSGKTTLLKYMANYRLEDKRNVITIEDTAEIDLDVPITLTTNAHSSIKSLFTESLRQNPSGIIIGESRDDTIIDILESSLSTELSMTTLHATSLPRTIQRIILMAQPRKMPREDIEELIKVTVSGIIYIKKRKVQNIWENTNDLHSSVFDIFQEVK